MLRLKDNTSRWPCDLKNIYITLGDSGDVFGMSSPGLFVILSSFIGWNEKSLTISDEIESFNSSMLLILCQQYNCLGKSAYLTSSSDVLVLLPPPSIFLYYILSPRWPGHHMTFLSSDEFSPGEKGHRWDNFTKVIEKSAQGGGQ